MPSKRKEEQYAGNRNRRFELRLSENELLKFIELENMLGLSRSEIIRLRVLENSTSVMVNASDLLKKLDGIGTELGRSGNNINQLARHANTLNKEGKIDPQVVNTFINLFSEYIKIQVEIEKAMRQLIRLMRN